MVRYKEDSSQREKRNPGWVKKIQREDSVPKRAPL